MTLVDSLMVSLFGMGIVFLVLIFLSCVLNLQSFLLRLFMINKKNSAVSEVGNTDIRNNQNDGGNAVIKTDSYETADNGWSAGELKLIGVDERTAAIIMAIVSHECQIPLAELQFKMIKAIN